MGYLRT